MRTLHITKDHICKIAKGFGQVALGCIGLGMALKKEDKEETKHKDRYNAGYAGAVEAIMDSDMFDSNKIKALSVLRKKENSEYYKAILLIMKTDMFDSKKIEAIKRI